MIEVFCVKGGQELILKPLIVELKLHLWKIAGVFLNESLSWFKSGNIHEIYENFRVARHKGMVARLIDVLFIWYELEMRDVGVNEVKKDLNVLENGIDLLFACSKKPIKFINMPIIEASKEVNDFLRGWQRVNGDWNIFFQGFKILRILYWDYLLVWESG